MAIKTLARRHQDIQIGDRQFRLTEFTLDELHYYLDNMQAIAPKAVEALGGNESALANYNAALEVSVREGERLMLWLLRSPIDGGPLPDVAWYRANVTPAIQMEVQEEVYALNGLEHLLGETMRLLMVARDQQAQTGSTTSTPSPTDTEPTP